MTREEAIAVLQEFYDYNKTLTPHGESWLQADITINRETQRNLAEALPLAIEAMSRLLTDPKTGLVPCGCGGKAAVKKGVNYRSGYYVICEKCECNIGLDRDDYLRPYGAYPTEEQAVSDWDTAMGYTAPPPSGAIVPDAGEMAPNGDEGAEQ